MCGLTFVPETRVCLLCRPRHVLVLCSCVCIMKVVEWLADTYSFSPLEAIGILCGALNNLPGLARCMPLSAGGESCRHGFVRAVDSGVRVIIHALAGISLPTKGDISIRGPSSKKYDASQRENGLESNRYALIPRYLLQ